MLGRKKDKDNAAKPTPVEEAAPPAEDEADRPAYATEPVTPASAPVIPPVPQISRRLADIPPISRSSEDGSVSLTENKRLTVGKEIKMSGDITACDTLIVEGTIDANLRDGREISIARGGRFIGSAEVDEADVSGSFSGRLIARQRLIVRTGGQIDGEIHYGQIEVEPGGEITGKLAVSDGHSGEIAALTDGTGKDDAASGQG